MHAKNQDLLTCIDSCHKESEIYTSYLEQITAHFNIVASITIYSDGINLQKKQKGREEYFQEDWHIPFNKNFEDNSIILNRNN